jgi:hypothetical protein
MDSGLTFTRARTPPLRWSLALAALDGRVVAAPPRRSPVTSQSSAAAGRPYVAFVQRYGYATIFFFQQKLKNGDMPFIHF